MRQAQTIVQNNDGTESPLDHIAPAFGRIGVQYNTSKLKSELFTNFSAWKNLEDFSASGEDNLVYATPKGMPSWWTLNVRASYEVINGLNLQAGIENIMDINYRTFASGIHAGGRNVFACARVRFWCLLTEDTKLDLKKNSVALCVLREQ